MARSLEPEDFLREAEKLRVIDVRSPGEFMQGHIPGAVSIPLFDDDERAVIGTLYTRSGSETAIRKGMEIATPKIPGYLSSLRAVSTQQEILVHCWRGGMRSAHMAELFERQGYRAGLLTGGYKAYRRHVRTGLGKPAFIVIIGGYTGSGKTDLLKRIGGLGCQVIDLEGIAHHKGSAFGALGQLPQPTNEQFENDLFATWSGLDLHKPVWMEDESRMIGKVTLPDPVYEKISNGILLRVDVPADIRIRRLVAEYAAFDKPLLADAIQRISERLGVPRTREALQAIAEGDFAKVAANVLKYYDKAYHFAIERRPGKEMYVFGLQQEPDDDTARILVTFIEEKLRNGTDLS